MKLLANVSLIILLTLAASSANAQPPEISAARIIQPPPSAKVAAAYFTIKNSSDEPLLVTGASSDAINKVELHLSAVVDDVAKMIHQDDVTIDANSSLEFEHGSYHLMLMGLKAPLTPGTMLAFELETSAGVLPVMIPIITPDEGSAMTSGSMDHGSMNHNAMPMEKNPTTMDHSDSNESMKHGDMDKSKSMDKK